MANPDRPAERGDTASSDSAATDDGPSRRLAGVLEPRSGRVMGLQWGADEAALERAHPDARLARDDGDIRTWSITQTVDPPGVVVSAEYTFEMGGLFAIDLRMRADEPERQVAWAELTLTLSQAFTVGHQTPDEAYRVLEEGMTRLTADALDRHIRLEELP